METSNSSYKNITIILLTGLACLIILKLLSISYPLYALIPLLKAMFLTAIHFIYGFSLLKLFKTSSPIQKESFTAIVAKSFSLGLIASTLYFFAAGMLKLLVLPVFLLYYLLPLPLLFLLRKQKHELMDSLHSFFKRPAVEYLVFLLPLIYAALPSSFYDTLAYHLGIPNLYIQNTAIISTPQLFYANTFIYYELSMIPAIFAGDMVPRLFHLLTGTLLILTAIDYAVSFYEIKKRYMLTLAIITMPMTVFLLTAVKNDLPSALFILMGMVTFPNYKHKHTQSVILSAVFWGFAIGVKYTNIIPLAVFVLVQLVTAIKSKKIMLFGKRMILAGLIVFAFMLPLMMKNYLFTGNPIFPFAANVFENKIEQWDQTRLDALKTDAKKLFHSAKDVLKAPLTLSFEDAGSGGRIGPLFLMFLPLLFFIRGKTLRNRWGWLYFSLAIILIGGHFKLSTRVWYIAFLLLCMYVITAYETLSGKIQQIMTVLFFGAVALNLFNAFGLHEYLYRSHDLYTGRISIKEYKINTFTAFSAIDYVNSNTPKDAKVLMVGEARGYYLKRPYQIASGYDYSILKKYIQSSRYPGEFIDNIKADGFQYIIFDSIEFQRLQKGYKRLTPDEAQRAAGVLMQLPKQFEKDGVMVLELL